jgi:hypothetical protein
MKESISMAFRSTEDPFEVRYHRRPFPSEFPRLVKPVNTARPNSGGCAQMQLRRYHLGSAATLETRENADAAAAGVADRHDAVFDRDAAFALALLA